MNSWTGELTQEPVVTSEPEAAEPHTTIAHACKVFITNREAAGLAPATLRKYRTFTKQITAFGDERGYVHARPVHR